MVIKTIPMPSGRQLKIFRDTSTKNPRLGDDIRSRFLFLHKQHHLGDPHNYKTPEEIEELVKEMGEIVIAPVFMFEEKDGKVLLDTEPFDKDGWKEGQDADCTGQLGVMYIHREFVEEKVGIWNEQARTEAMLMLMEELNEYNEWLNDDVYGFTLIDSDGTIMQQETGYIGSDHAVSGLYDDAGVDLDEKGAPLLA